MAQRMAWGLAAALLLRGVGAQGGVTSAYVSALDLQVAGEAREARNLYCKGGFKGDIDREGDRAVMEGVLGGTNVFEEVLMEAKNQDEVGDLAAEKIGGGAVGTAAAKLAFGIFLIVLWFCCSFWSCCPCCKRCRCGAKQRITSKKVKFLIMAILIAIAVVIVTVAGVGASGMTRVADGFDNLACTAGELLNGVLSGQATPYFMGFIPLLRKFETMEGTLSPGAPFMNGLSDLIDSTSAIEEALSMTTETMDLLTASLVMPAEVETSYHSCQLCDQLTPVLATASTELASGVASSLADTRKEVKGQLQGEQADVLKSTIRSASMPLVEVKNLARDTLSAFTDTEKFLQIRNQVNSEGDNAVGNLVNSVIALAVVLVAFIGLTLFLWLCKPGTPEKPLKAVPCCAGCNWCCAWWFAIFAITVGGIILTITFFLSGVCLIMDDLSVVNLQKMSPALGLNITGEENRQLLDIIDQCIVPQIPGTNAALLDIIKTRDNASAPLVSLNDKIVRNTKEQIKSKFDDINSKMSGGNTELATNPEMVSLIELLRDVPIDQTIVFTDTSITNDAAYSAMFTNSDLAQAAAGSSVACASGATPLAPTVTIEGIDNFVTTLGTIGTGMVDNPGTCVDTVICPVAGAASTQCAAGNNFLTLKSTIRSATYNCPVFEDPAFPGQRCDPKDMVDGGLDGFGRTIWLNSCQQADGTFTMLQVTCNFDDWVVHIQNFHRRIQLSLERVDKTVTESGTFITDGMYDLVEEFIFTPIDEIAAGVTCGFMAGFYRGLVDGMCYQGAVGFIKIGESYQWTGGLALILVIIAYGIWRRTIDNWNYRAKVNPSANEVEVVGK